MYSPLTYATTAAYSPDGTKLFVAGYKGVQIFNASTGAFLSSLPTLYPDVNSVAISPDGKTLAIGGSSLTSASPNIEIWDITHLSLMQTINPNVASINALAFSPDGKTLVDGGAVPANPESSGWQPLQTWDVSTGDFIANLPTTAVIISSVQYSKDGKSLLVGGNPQNLPTTGVVEIFNVASQTLTQTFSTAATNVASVAFSPSHEQIAVGGYFFSSSTSGYVGVLELWDSATGKLDASYNTASDFVSSVAFSPDGRTLAAGTYLQYDTTGLLQFWEVKSGTLIDTLNSAAKNGVQFVCFSPNGKSLAECEWVDNALSGQITTNANIWNVSTRKLSTTLNTVAYIGSSATAFSADGKTLISGMGGLLPNARYTFYGDLLYSTATTGKINQTEATVNDITAMVMLPNGKILADCTIGSSNASVELRDAQSGKLLTTVNSVQGGFAFYNSIACSADGTLIAVGLSTENTTGVVKEAVQIWNVRTGKQVASLATAANNQVASLCFSPDGTQLVIGGSGWNGNSIVGVLELWNPSTGTFIGALYPDIYYIFSAKFSPDGSYLGISGIKYLPGLDQTAGGLELWDAKSLEPVAYPPLPSMVGSVSTVAFSVDSQVLYAGTDLGIYSFGTTSNMLLEHDAYGGISSLALSPDGTLISYTAGAPLQGVMQSPLASVKLSSNAIFGGQSVSALVSLSNPAPEGGQTVFLTASNSNISLPENITIGPGQTAIRVPVKTLEVSSQQAGLISARINGFSQSASLALSAPGLKSLTLNPATVKGGKVSTATVTLDMAAPPNGLIVSLSSNHAQATVPNTVTIPAGKTSVQFSVLTTAVTKKTLVVISTALGESRQSASLTISP